LVRQGHDLTLGASGDSITQATLVRARTLASRRECRAKTWEQRSLPCLVQIYDRWLTQLEPHIFGHMNMVSASPPTHEFLLSFAPALIFDDHLDARQTPVFSAKKSFRLLS
jgi:hypothetical protein